MLTYALYEPAWIVVGASLLWFEFDFYIIFRAILVQEGTGVCIKLRRDECIYSELSPV